MTTDTKHGNIASALAAAQAELQNPTTDSKNPHFKSAYASLAAVRDTIVPVLAKHGIAVVQLPSFADNLATCVTRLLHSSGEHVECSLSLPVSKSDAQGIGSAITYARRYSLLAIACVAADEDDDGNAAVGRPTPKHGSNPGMPAVRPAMAPPPHTPTLTPPSGEKHPATFEEYKAAILAAPDPQMLFYIGKKLQGESDMEMRAQLRTVYNEKLSTFAT